MNHKLNNCWMDEQNLSKLLKTAQNKWLKQNSKISSRRVNEWILPARKKIEINESVKPLGASEDFFPLVIHFLSLI